MRNSIAFISLLSRAELFGGEIPLCDVLDKAAGQLEKFEGPVDAIIGFWDFAVSSMVPILCQRFRPVIGCGWRSLPPTGRWPGHHRTGAPVGVHQEDLPAAAGAAQP